MSEIKQIVYDIIAISDKNMPRFTTEHANSQNEPIFIKHCTKRKESNLSIITMTCIKTTRIITTNVVNSKNEYNPKINK